MKILAEHNSLKYILGSGSDGFRALFLSGCNPSFRTWCLQRLSQKTMKAAYSSEIFRQTDYTYTQGLGTTNYTNLALFMTMINYKNYSGAVKFQFYYTE